MKLETIKEQIESNNILNTFIIFQCENNFIPHQYVNEISKRLNLNIEYIEDLDSVVASSFNVFFTDTPVKSLKVYHCDTFEYYNKDLMNEENLIIICKKVDKSTQEIYNDYIVTVNTLEHWCVKDYLYSILSGVKTEYIDWLMEVCNYDINRLQLEAEKLLLFTENERNIVFNEMLDEKAFCDISNKGIFDFTEAITKQNLESLNTIYTEIENMDVEPLGVVTILYKNFLKYLSVWYSRNPTPENTGLSSKQIWAINRLPHIWTEQDIVYILNLLTSIDFKIKNGDLPVSILRDYLVVKILERCK